MGNPTVKLLDSVRQCIRLKGYSIRPKNPNQKRVIKDVNIEAVISKAVGILKGDMDLCRESSRISKSVTTDRDLLIYIAWQLGVATNQQIGEKLGLTYSAVSQRVRAIKELLKKDKELERKYKHIKSLIKI